jgi:hypothetical protein
MLPPLSPFTHSALFGFCIQCLKRVFALLQGPAPSSQKDIRDPVGMRQSVGASLKKRSKSMPMAMSSRCKVFVSFLQSL